MIAYVLVFAFYVLLFLLTNWFWTIVALIGGAIFYYMCLSVQHGMEQQQKAIDLIDRRVQGIKDFTADQILQSPYSDCGIALDTKREKVCLFNSGPPFRPKLYDFGDILSVEIIEDGHTTIKTERSSQIGGAIVGGLLLGGVGAVLGGLSGNKNSKNIVTRIDLRITVNNMQKPVHDVILFMQDEGSTLEPTAARNTARHWNGALSVIIKRASQEADSPLNEESKQSPKNQVVTASALPLSTADELRKLADLVSTGHLTEAEYQQQKSRLLNS